MFYLLYIFQQTDLELKQLQQKQEAFIIRYQESLKLDSKLTLS